MATAETSEEKTPAAEKPVTKKPVTAQGSATRVTYLHDLRPAPGSNRPKMRVGRDEGSEDKTSGRGTKSTKARYQMPAHFEGGQMPLHTRLLRLRGFRDPFHVEYRVVNLDRLGGTFPEGGTLAIADLVMEDLVREGELVKVFGSGEAGAEFNSTVDAWSQSAKTRVEAKGGSLTAR